MSRLGEQRRLRDFGDALGGALAVRGWTQRQLGDALGGLAQSAVSAWKSAQAEPGPGTVFAIEEALGLAPGTLSRHLGYVPAGAAAKVGGSIVDVVTEDGTLLPAQKEALLAVYRAFRNSS